MTIKATIGQPRAPKVFGLPRLMQVRSTAIPNSCPEIVLATVLASDGWMVATVIQSNNSDRVGETTRFEPAWLADFTGSVTLENDE